MVFLEEPQLVPARRIAVLANLLALQAFGVMLWWSDGTSITPYADGLVDIGLGYLRIAHTGRQVSVGQGGLP